MVRNAQFKSLFILPAIAVTALLLMISLVMLVFSPDYRLAWLGAAMASAPLPLLIAKLMLKPAARTSEYLPLHILLMLAGLVLAGRAMYADFVDAWQLYREFSSALVAAFNVSAESAPGLVAILASVLFLLYVFWYSRFGRFPDVRIDVGSKMPDFEVHDLNGNVVRTVDLKGSPTVYLFYRGNWCPLCMAQIDELVERYQAMEQLGIVVCLISSQPPVHVQALADKLGVPFRFLVDTDNKAAEALDIHVLNGVPRGTPGGYAADTVLPTLIVASANGTIVFSDQTDNYRVRPEPDIFLAILRRAGAVRT